MRRSSLAWLAAALSAGALLPAAASAAVETWSASPGEKVFPATARPAGAITSPTIVAARDEYEGVQIVARSDAPLRMEPVVSDLTGPATIPSSDVQLFRVGYVRLLKPSTGVDTLEGDGRYPDPLLSLIHI